MVITAAEYCILELRRKFPILVIHTGHAKLMLQLARRLGLDGLLLMQSCKVHFAKSYYLLDLLAPNSVK